MGLCFDLPKHGPVCIGDTFAQLNTEGFGLTETGIGLFALIAATVFLFILRQPSKR